MIAGYWLLIDSLAQGLISDNLLPPSSFQVDVALSRNYNLFHVEELERLLIDPATSGCDLRQEVGPSS